jgi:YVTN family beta-propeller protein
MKRFAFLMLSLCLVAISRISPAQAYTVTHTYTVGGDGGWDYVTADAPSHRLFIARSNRLMVVDMNDGHLIKEITGFNGAHGAALAPGTGHGFATSGEDSTVVMFDSRTYKTLARIRAADDADAIIYDPVSKHIFTMNGDANSSTVIDPRTGTVVATIPLGGKPEEGQSARNGMIYANLTDSSRIVEIDAKNARLTGKSWSTAPCANPVSLAIDTRHQRLFSGCRNGTMAISDYKNGRVVATVPVGRGVDGGGYDPVKRDAYTSNGEGTLTVVHQDTPDKYHVVENVATAQGARTMTVDPASHRLYTLGAKYGPVPAESTATNPRRRPPILPGTFMVLVVEPSGSH